MCFEFGLPAEFVGESRDDGVAVPGRVRFRFKFEVK